MLRKLFKAVWITLLVTLVAGGVLYLAGLRVVLDGGGGFHLQFVSSPDRQAAELARHREAQRAAAAAVPAQSASAPVPVAPAPASPSAGADGAGPAAAPVKSEGPMATAVSAAAGSTYWTGFRGPRRNGTYDQQPILTAWPVRWPEATVEAAGRRGLCLVRDRARPRLHDRAARVAGSRRRLRRAQRPRALDQRVERDVPRVDGRRRAACHAGVGRRAGVRARRHRRIAFPGRGDRPGGVAHRHPEGCGGEQPAMGDGRVAAGRRRYRHRAAGRIRAASRWWRTRRRPANGRGRRSTISSPTRRRWWPNWPACVSCWCSAPRAWSA